MINRTALQQQVETALRRSPVVLLSGPRQCGKTTLARTFLAPDQPGYFDLEDPADLERLTEPMTALRPLDGLVVIDEVQRRPDLFPALRVLADRRPLPARFLILGSAGGELLRQSSESLAGRLERVELTPFSLTELGATALETLWQRGGFPPSFLAGSGEDSLAWREGFIQTLLERDFPGWGVRTPAAALRRFWALLAHYHGQTWNAAEPARALGIGQSAVRDQLDLLTDAYMLRQLQPFHANLAKRQVKAPRVYLRDSGLLHALLGIRTPRDLLVHPKCGASWEGFALEQALRVIPHDEAWFWSTHQGAEIDLLLRQGDRLIGLECKRQDAPRRTRSMTTAKQDLALDHLYVLYPGPKRFVIGDKMEALPLELLSDPDVAAGL
jgi:predicted AAA+ superfamily ATPase